MDNLQPRNPETDLIRSLAGSGVTIPGQTETDRAQLGQAMHESNVHQDILDQVMSDQTGSPSYAPQAPAPPTPEVPQARAYTPPPPQPSGPDPNQLLQALQMEQARNQALTQDAEMAVAFRELLNEDPELAAQVLAKFNGQSGPGTPAADGSAPPQAAEVMLRRELAQVRKQMSELQGGQENLRLQNEANILQQTYPGLFNAQSAEQYRRNQGFRSLTDAFNHQLGAAIGYMIQTQSAQQRIVQTQQLQNAYHAQSSQQPVGGAYEAPSSAGPPPAHDASIMRPGGSAPAAANDTRDQLMNFRPQNKRQLQEKLRAVARLSGMMS